MIRRAVLLAAALVLIGTTSANAVPEQHFGKLCTTYAPASPAVVMCRTVNLNDFSPKAEALGWLDVSGTTKVHLFIYKVTLWHDPDGPGPQPWHVDFRNDADKYLFGSYLESSTDWVNTGCGIYHTAFTFQLYWYPSGADTGVLTRDSANVDLPGGC